MSYPLGRFIIFGGDGERDDQPRADNQDDQPDQDQQDDSQQQSSDQDSGPSNSEDNAGQDSGSSGPSIEDQLDEERKKNIRLTKELNKANADKSKAETDRDAAKERDEYKSKYDKSQKMLESKFLIWSIATDKKYNWNNPEDVIAFIKSDEINIDVDKEEIEGLDLALKRIAKDKPYLLVQKKQDEEPRAPSGSHPFGSKSGDAVSETKRLGEKYKIPGFGSHAVRPV